MQPLRRQLRAFIVTNFLFGEQSREFSFTDDDSLIESGIIDSTGVVELVAFVEEHYAIPIQDDELVPENLDSVARLSRFIERKLAECDRRSAIAG